MRLEPADFGLENQPVSEEELGELRDALTFLHDQKRTRVPPACHPSAPQTPAPSALTHCDGSTVRLAHCRADVLFPRAEIA